MQSGEEGVCREDPERSLIKDFVFVNLVCPLPWPKLRLLSEEVLRRGSIAGGFSLSSAEINWP